MTNDVTPEAIALRTAFSVAASVPCPPMLMFATAGFTAFWATQSIPAATCVPCPLQSVSLPSPTVFVPRTARPPKVLWVMRMPVSLAAVVS
jgi:hypothetical protein